MLTTKNEQRALYAISLIGGAVAEEITRVCRTRRSGVSGLREISLRAVGRSSVGFSEERVPLYTALGKDEVEQIAKRLCDGALYAHRDTIASGYITLKGGIRVGISGYAKYEYKSFVGVSDISSLLFRIPGHACDFSQELYSAFLQGVGSGMLIYSPPGAGKTTALRSLALSVGSGRGARRVAVIDERCEFDEEDYAGAEVDILKGYKRRRGIEIATRTMSPEILMIDEIGADDAEGIGAVSKCGIPLIATSHAASLEELRSKPSLSALLSSGVFDVFVGIRREGERYLLTVDRN